MTIYRHTQSGTLVRWALAGGAVLAVVAMVPAGRGGTPATVVAGVVATVLLLALWQFGSLTVEVAEDRVSLRFGPGLIRKSFPAAEILGVEPVRNRWWWGWGIRLTPHGWLYNVSGLEAVELRLASGRKVRIGTDEPQRLAAAVRGVVLPAAR